MVSLHETTPSRPQHSLRTDQDFIVFQERNAKRKKATKKGGAKNSRAKAASQTKQMDVIQREKLVKKSQPGKK